ncbi:MAG: BlaI/MecI/CopY family transcriptional regulator [Aerococcaceae bacterium]|nr:BlaI/MecI/CopY family transcriptional regulator [Aerococcaceae bacterium]
MSLISSAEWHVMRVVWANHTTTSRTIIDTLLPITSWKEGTIKSLINRLIQKSLIHCDKTQSPYQLSPLLTQEEATLQQLNACLETTCCTKRGHYLAALLEQQPLSQSDCQTLLAIITQQLATAPEHVTCSCPKGQCNCHSERNHTHGH